MGDLQRTGNGSSKRIGFLGTGLSTGMQNQMWQGALDAARAQGAQLVFYPAYALQTAIQLEAPSNVLYNFVDAERIDGLLIWTGGLVESTGLAEAAAFFERYESFPVVTIGSQLKDYPDLSVDSYGGMRAAVDHLIEAHDCRDIGIIRGPVNHPEADQRYQACVEALEAHGLPLNPALLVQGAFSIEIGIRRAAEAVEQWLNDPAIHLDAVVAATDYMALAAMQTIEAHGLRVPEDVAVIGFDDIDTARANTPTLTTVRQPFYDLGYQAAEMLSALIAGDTLPRLSAVPSQLVIRESCGCASQALSLVDMSPNGQTGTAQPMAAQDHALRQLQEAAHEMNMPVDALEGLTNALQQDLSAEDGETFLPTLRQSLLKSAEEHFDAMAWQNALSVLRQYALSSANGRFEARGDTLFNQARVLVAEIAERTYVKRHLDVTQNLEALSNASEVLITSFDRERLMTVLATRLPKLGFPGFYLSLYEDPEHPQSESRLILAYDRGLIDLPPEDRLFPSYRLVPDALLPRLVATSVVVEPLYFGDMQLGMIVLEVGPAQGVLYENLRSQISSALQGSHLLQDAQRHAGQLEMAVAQTLTTAEEILTVGTQTAQHARLVADVAQQSANVSRDGQAAVAKTIEGMEAVQQQVADIADSMLSLTQQIEKAGQIIDTVKEMADQSKMLALNARIEAARAGEQERGFGVVASEMRRLAEQSRESTAEVRAILREITKATLATESVIAAGMQGAQDGMELASHSGDAIRDLATTIDQAAAAATEIAASTQQQRTGMEDLVRTMQTIRQGTSPKPG